MSGRRMQALAAARLWIGTPYRHQGSRRGVGADCVGLVRGVWRELYGSEPERLPAYSPDWAEAGGEDRLYEASLRHFSPLGGRDGEAGDLVLFRWREGRPAKHCGILDEGGRLIHAYEGACVLSSPLTPGWKSRICGTFRFPD
ncbi:NlpC/P60 family protein [Aureimonas populi]|uniref:NlpC/P60 family protein n=1 Tax=Aureimonas populi TaxID=1701758 RepID=A0ABW5CKC0_9HYPH|nr:NlpC/P60 family protein [Aureimonas populi]